MNPKTTGPAPRKKRRVVRWFASALALIIAWQSWRAYDRSLAVKEAYRNDIWVIESGPVQDIRDDWKSAFRRETWRMPSRNVKIHSIEELTEHKDLLLRLSPTVLTISDASKLARLSELPACPFASGLDLSECRILVDLTMPPSLAHLKALAIRRCWKLSDLTPITKHQNLERLILDSCQNISDLSPLKDCRSLKHIYLLQCASITSLKPLTELPSMQSLRLKYNISIPQSEIDALKAARPDITFE
jgi:hypothetical protein